MTRVSVVVPVHDDAGNLRVCLAALRDAAVPGMEIVVADDASRDDAAAVARAAGARVVRLERQAGPAGARNRGVRAAAGDVLVFVDADVRVRPDTVRRLMAVLDARPELTAVFGSYDDAPHAPGFVSQYRNLLHHFVHQDGNPEASTFWAGCGAVRRAAFDALGGFDEGDYARAVEDIELGYRLRAAGHRIALAREVQVTHLKRWTLRSVLYTDAMLRALPWARLLLARRPPADLNIGPRQRASVALTCLAAVLLPLGLLRPGFAVAALAAVLGVLVANRRLLGAFARARGALFAAATVPMLLLHYLEGGLCFAWAWLAHRRNGVAAGRVREPAPPGA